jgi:hypothetical protein
MEMRLSHHSLATQAYTTATQAFDMPENLLYNTFLEKFVAGTTCSSSTGMKHRYDASNSYVQ